MIPPLSHFAILRGGARSRDKDKKHGDIEALSEDTPENKEWVKRTTMMNWELDKTKKNAPQYPPQLITFLMKAEPRNIHALNNAKSKAQTEHIVETTLAKAGISSHFMGKEKEDEVMKHIEALCTAIQHQQQVLHSLLDASVASSSAVPTINPTIPPEIMKQSILETRALDSLTSAVISMEKKMEMWETTYLAEVDRLPIPESKSDHEGDQQEEPRPPQMSMRFPATPKRTQRDATSSPSDKPVSSVLDVLKEKAS